MSNLYFNEESDYSEENTSVNENFDFIILHFSLSLNRKKRVVSAMRKKLTYSRFSCRFIKCQNRKSRLVQMQTLENEAREIHCLCCGEVMQCLMLRQNPRACEKYLATQLLQATARLLATLVSLIYLIDQFFLLSPVQLSEMKTLGESKALSFCF